MEDTCPSSHRPPSPKIPSSPVITAHIPPLLALPPRLAARLLTVHRHKCPSPNPLNQKNNASITHHRRSALDARREKLAARSAHAELVRNRAAAERARAEGDLSARVARALRVYRAREQHLQNVADTAAAEVRRAKRVARESRERDLEAARKVRETAEERMARAAERRQLLLVRNGHSGQRRQTDAARTLQRAWRQRKFRSAIRKWRDLHFTGDVSRDTPFEDLTAKMRDQSVLDSLYDLVSTFGASIQSKQSRTVLCAYLLVGHSGEVLSFWGNVEEQLVESASKVVLAIDTLCPTGFGKLVANYFRAFDRWKEQDASVMVTGLVAAFVELDAIWGMVKDDVMGGAADEYGQGVRMNQTVILRQLGQLVGSQTTHQMLRDAVRERRQQDKAKKPRHAQADPEGANNLRSTVSSDASSAPPAGSPTLPGSPRLTSSMERVSQLTKAKSNEYSPFSLLPDNRSLVHELALNPAYRLSIPARSARTTLHEALVAGMTQVREPSLQQYWIMAMAEHIRVRFMSLLEGPSSLSDEIEGLVGVNAVSLALESGSYSNNIFFSAAAGLLSRLCAPFRDETVAQLATFLEDSRNSDGEKIQKFLYVIDLLTLDHANFLLSRAAPVLLQHGRDYEVRAFTEISTQTGLPKLIHIWRGIVSTMRADQARRDPESVGHDPITVNKVYTKMIASLIRVSPVLLDDVPETLDLDFDRLLKMNRNVALIIAIGAILLTAKNVLRRDVRENWMVESSRIWAILTAGDDPDGGREINLNELTQSVIGALTLTHPMPPASVELLSSTVRRILSSTICLHCPSSMGAELNHSQRTRPVTPSDPTVKLLISRFRNVILSFVPSLKDCLSPSSVSLVAPRHLATGKQSAGNLAIMPPRQNAAVNPALASAMSSVGLVELASKVDQLVVQPLDTVVKLDWEWRRTWYDQLGVRDGGIAGV